MLNTSQTDSLVEEPVRTSLQFRKQEFARNAIWDAAIDLFAEKGFDETTVDKIVEHAGTSRRSFFRHFESKNDLMAQPVIEWGAVLVEAIHSCPPSLSTSELFHRVVLRAAEESASNPRSRKVMEIIAKYPAAREAQLSRVAYVQDRVVEAFSRRCNDPLMAHLLAGLTFAVLSTTHHRQFATGEKDISPIARHVLAALSSIACVNDPSAKFEAIPCE